MTLENLEAHIFRKQALQQVTEVRHAVAQHLAQPDGLEHRRDVRDTAGGEGSSPSAGERLLVETSVDAPFQAWMQAHAHDQ